MISNRELKKLVEELKADIKEIKKSQDPRIVAKARRFDEIIEKIDDIVLPIDSAVIKYNEEGRPFVRVYYTRLTSDIYFDDRGEAIYEPFFVSANHLNLTPFSDLEKIEPTISNLRAKLKK